jgi:hypothetical protein
VKNIGIDGRISYLLILYFTCSPTNGGRSVGIIRLRTKAADFFYFTYTLFSDALSNSVVIASNGRLINE